MATKWSGWTNRHQCGIDVDVLDGVTQSNPDYRVRIFFRQRTSYTFFNFDGTVRWSGLASGSHTGRLNDDNVLTHASITRSWDAYYSGKRTFSIRLRGTTDGTGGTSDVTRTITVPRRPTAKPGTDLYPSLDQVTSSSMRANWTNSGPWRGPDEDRYVRIQLSTNSSFTNVIRNVRAKPPNNDWTFTNLDRTRKYYMRVRREGDWWDANRRGNWSSTRSATTDPEVPSAPHSYEAREITRNSASGEGTKLNDNGGESPDNIRVQYNTSASSSGATTKTMGAWVKTRMTGLTAATEYFFRHAVHNSAGWSSYGPWVSFTTSSTAPDDPAPVTFSNIGDEQADLNWVHPALNGATRNGYRVRVSRNSSMTDIQRVSTEGPSTTSQTFTGLTPGTQYWADVQVLASPEDSGVSEPSSFTTTGTLATLFLWHNVSGVWKQITLWHNVSGVWKQIKLGHNVSGVWKETE